MLFDSFSFSGLTLKNRLVRSATYEKRADDDGFVTDSLIELYEELAKGQCGLLITGNALVHPSGRSVPNMICIHNDNYIKGLQELASAVHELDGIIALQLGHGGRQCPEILLGGQTPLAPSAVYEPIFKLMPRPMTDNEIWEIIEAFGEGAQRARYSGFDAVQIHGAHGYLVSSFMSPYTNRRDDYWGGDEERRFHFVEEVYKAVRKAVGNDYPVLIKMNADDYLDGGLRPVESRKIARRLEGLGIDAIEISGGMLESPIRTIRPGITEPFSEAYLRGNGRFFKEGLKSPVIVTGGMRSREVMEDVLQKNEADLIGMSRPLIREPELPRLMREGKPSCDCVSCNGCIRFNKMDKVNCVNLNCDNV